MIPLADRAGLVLEARALYGRVWRWSPPPPTKACLYWALALQVLVMKHYPGLEPLMLQAGSCSWPLCLASEDDGVRPTHFGYEFDPRVPARPGALPELHVWLAHRGPDTVIDPTTGTWIERAQDAGLVWSAPAPPAWLWATAQELTQLETRYPFAIQYKPALAACEIAGRAAQADLVGPLVAYVFNPRQRTVL